MRLVYLALAALMCASLLAAEPHRLKTNSSHVGVRQDEVREVVCWGDSMTEGVGAGFAVISTPNGTYDASYKSYPQILQDLCGIKTYNYGVPGANSREIVSMQGGYGPVEDQGAFGIFDREVAEDGANHLGDILVLEIGSNGGWDNDYGELIAQYKAMIEHAKCKDYLIIGDTDDPGTSEGDRLQEAFKEGDGPGETRWEKALKDAFGDRFINMRVYLIEHGLEVCGLQKDEADKEGASFGCVPSRLRFDWTHLNSYGYYAQAYGVYEQGVKLGLWKAKDA